MPYIDLAKYLFTRLHQLGVRHVHGVPGDYNLTACDYIEESGLGWVGNANELNAGYAADGYARIKGISALITSFGVGELSAINAIGAAYAERAPVVHIVGTASTTLQNARECLHHSLGDGNFRAFADMYKLVTVAQANLIDSVTAPALIDETLKQCLLHSRPVYIELPTDRVKAQVPAPSDLFDFTTPGYDSTFEDGVVAMLLSKLYDAKRPLLLVDGFTARFDVKKEINDLVSETGFPTLTTPFGKSIVDEDHPNFCGVYTGFAGKPANKAWVDACDLVLRFGPLNSEINTFGSTALPPTQATVTFENHSVCFGLTKESLSGERKICLPTLLRKLLKHLDKTRLPQPDPYPNDKESRQDPFQRLPPMDDESVISQTMFWPTMSKFLRPHDIVMTETGTSSYGGLSMVLPKKTTLINSAIWLSIGYMLGACQGAALAQRDMIHEGTRPQGRTILFEGDGSLQMTAQTISDIIRNKLDVIIFIPNNNGYTIERIIHGPRASYNDVQPWRNLDAPNYFGAPRNDPAYPVRTKLVKTWKDLNEVLGDPDIQEGHGLTMVEVIMDIDDAPVSLGKFVEYLRKRNSGES